MIWIIIVIAGLLIYFTMNNLKEESPSPADQKRNSDSSDFKFGPLDENNNEVKNSIIEVQKKDAERKSNDFLSQEVANVPKQVSQIEFTFNEEFAVISFSQLLQEIENSKHASNSNLRDVIQSFFSQMFNIALDRFEDESYKINISNNDLLMMNWEDSFNRTITKQILRGGTKDDLQSVIKMWISETYSDLLDLHEDYALYPNEILTIGQNENVLSADEKSGEIQVNRKIRQKYQRVISMFDNFDMEHLPTVLNDDTNFYQMGWAGATTIASVSIFEISDKVLIEFELDYNKAALKRNGIDPNSLPPIYKKEKWSYNNSVSQDDIYSSVSRKIENLFNV